MTSDDYDDEERAHLAGLRESINKSLAEIEERNDLEEIQYLHHVIEDAVSFSHWCRNKGRNARESQKVNQ